MNKKIPDLLKDHIKKEYTSGRGATELARTFGVSRSAIYNLINGAQKQPKVIVPPSAEVLLLMDLTGLPEKTVAGIYDKCLALDAVELNEITPMQITSAGLNIARALDTNTFLQEVGYALIPYPLPAIINTETGLTSHISWVDIFVLLLRPRAWVRYMTDNGKAFADWGLFKEDAQ